MYRNKKTFETFFLKVCKEKFVTLNIVMYFPKGFFLKNAIDKKLSELAASGILQFWINNYVDKKYLNFESPELEPQILQIQHLIGVFNVIFIMMGFAIVIFFIEIFTPCFMRAFNNISIESFKLTLMHLLKK